VFYPFLEEPMFRFSLAALLAVGLALLLDAGVRADYIPGARTPSSKAGSSAIPGARGDITVPYLTSGGTTLGVANGVAPVIYSAPQQDNRAAPGIQPNFNLIYYGSAKAFSSVSVGATQRQPNVLRR
jgi:hypothetical protein